MESYPSSDFVRELPSLVFVRELPVPPLREWSLPRRRLRWRAPIPRFVSSVVHRARFSSLSPPED
ncbi:Hypothetical protein FKW44_003330 [Caligus rogercresseyi]|uniref:Uncharacterized protein n=1 Tax=Caligus rogercresseyi TaxID=217165 RepID=A0A7T8QX05_CALRO|nr:Hypothetical protein FKW44_003330 [Caligus rogercresseyi]